MRYHALATDFDGTLAHDGQVADSTVEALHHLRASGRHLIMVTGRELPELQHVCPELNLFDWVVAENGALLYHPATQTEKVLMEPPPEKFIAALRAKHVGPMSVGRVIVATWQPYEKIVLETIRDMQLELRVIFNKGAVMVLPAGVTKATGLAAALKAMGLSAHNVVGVGDAENDHAFFRSCELSCAVANALPAVKETADMVTLADHGAGVVELIEGLLRDDLAPFDDRLQRHNLPLGTSDGGDFRLPSYGHDVLVCGTPATDAVPPVAKIVELLRERKYQFCLVDAAGVHDECDGSVIVEGRSGAAHDHEALRPLKNPESSAIVCLKDMPVADRPAYLRSLLAQCQSSRQRVGRPHWVVIEQAESLLPVDGLPFDLSPVDDLPSLLLATSHPEGVSRAVLERVATVVSAGPRAASCLAEFAKAIGAPLPSVPLDTLAADECWLWQRDGGKLPVKVQTRTTKSARALEA